MKDLQKRASCVIRKSNKTEERKLSETILEYIGLKLNRLSTKLTKIKPTFTITKTVDNSGRYKVYKKINIKDLDILVGDSDRTTDIAQRYSEALPLQTYIKEDKEGFGQLVESCSLDNLKKIEKQQLSFQEHIPYFIKYEKNYLWQIYYSKDDDKYFMLFPAKEGEKEVLLYAIKKKLEGKKAEVFVPICKEEISDKFYSAKELEDIQNYIKLFTKQWPEIVEVYDGKQVKLYIMGETKLRDNFSTKYRMVLTSKEDAEDFYTVLKAVYVLTTETNYLYSFTPGIDEKGNLQFLYDKKAVTIKNIQEFISNETGKQQALKYTLKAKIENEKEQIEKIKDFLKKQSEVYVKQEKQIIDFMNCKKSLFGKMKYFFTNSKKITAENKNLLTRLKEENAEIETLGQKEEKLDNHDYTQFADIFTLADLVGNTMEVKKISAEEKNYAADIKVLKLKQKNMERKTENAQKYLDEIEKHKRSLFDFWRFTNKDNANELAEGQSQVEEMRPRLEFNFDDERDELGQEMDAMQRQVLTDEECDAVYLSKFILPALNSIVTKSDTYNIDECYDSLLQNLGNKEKYSDLFGGIGSESENLRKLKNKQHREIPRDVYNILKFTPETSLEDFKETCKHYGKLLSEAYNKIVCKYDIEVYYAARNKGFITATINPYELVDAQNADKIYKTKLSNAHMLFFTNIIMYNNTSKTLPVGMDEDNGVLIKVGEIKEIGKEKLNIIVEKNLFDVEIRKVTLIEEGKRGGAK